MLDVPYTQAMRHGLAEPPAFLHAQPSCQEMQTSLHLSREKSWAIGTAVNAGPVRLQRCTTPGYITDPAKRGKDPTHRSSPLPALPGCQHCPMPR